MKKKTMYLQIYHQNRADLRYTGVERSDTNNDLCGKTYCQKTKGSKKSHGRKPIRKEFSDTSDSDGSDFSGAHYDKPERKKGKIHCRKTKTAHGYPDEMRFSIGTVSAETRPPRCWIICKSWGVLEVLNPTMASVTREDAGASPWYPLSGLLERGVDYREYSLESNEGSYRVFLGIDLFVGRRLTSSAELPVFRY